MKPQTMSAAKIVPRQSQKGSRGKNSKAMSAEVSPDSKCPICLDVFNNISHLDRCLHKFCFRCILEWSKNKAECPLCKQPFSSIYHSVKSDEDFQRHDIKQHVENNSFGYFEGVRFRYRTTLTGVRQQMRRTYLPPDGGVMFESSTNPPQQSQDRYVRRMLMRLEAKRRAAREGRAVNNVREEEMINFRRELYRQGVRVRAVKDGGRSRDVSAEFYQRNPACLHRLVPWIKRELSVLYGAHGSLVNIVQHIVMSRITCYDMEDRAIQEELRPFLQGRTEHFLHELISFAKSPFNMEAYDQHAVYDCPASASNEDSSSNSSVIAISEDEDNPVEMDHPGDSMSTLSHSLWDDETPGPSYSTTAEQNRTQHLSPLELDLDSSSEEESQEFKTSYHDMSTRNQTNMPQGDQKNEDCVSSDNDDCVIIGFVKPTSERTPELVQLSSDSDESAYEDTKEVPRQSHHIRFSSCSPAASHRSDSSRAGRTESIETGRHLVSDSKERCSLSTSSKQKTSIKPKSSEMDRRYMNKERSRDLIYKDRDHRRRKRDLRTGERRHSSKSPVNSNDSLSSLSAETGYSYSHSRDFSKNDTDYRKKNTDHSYQSYSHYRRERNGSVTHYTHKQSYYYSSRKYSRSRSRSHSRDSQRQHRRRSRSRSYSSSRSPSTRRKYHHDKPGGKRKYKTRHLEEPLSLNPNSEGDSVLKTKHKKKNKQRHRKKSKEKSKKSSYGDSTDITRTEKEHERTKHHKKKKRKHKKSTKHKSAESKPKPLMSQITSVITINSDSDLSVSDNIPHVSGSNIMTGEQINAGAVD